MESLNHFITDTANMLGINETEIIQSMKNLEQHGYLEKCTNSDGEIIFKPKMPDDDFRNICKENEHKNIDLSDLGISSMDELQTIDTSKICKMDIVDRISDKVSINEAILENIYAQKSLNFSEKEEFLKIYFKINDASKKLNISLDSGFIEPHKLAKEIRIKKRRLYTLLNKFADLGLIYKKRFFIQKEDKLEDINNIEISEIKSKEFSKPIWKIDILEPERSSDNHTLTSNNEGKKEVRV